jgi:putative hydrolase of the HAD superfamily
MRWLGYRRVGKTWEEVCEAGRMIKAALFDLDETLLDRKSSAEKFLRLQYREVVIAQFGYAVSEVEYVAMYFRLEREGLLKKADLYSRMVTSLGLPEDAAQLLFDHFQRFYPEMACPMEGAHEALQSLRADGLAVGIISNGEAVVQKRKIQVAGFSELANVVLISGEIGIRKPDQRIFELAATKLGLNPVECIFIGDNPIADVLGATKAGMAAVYFGTLESWPSKLSRPTYCSNSLLEVSRLIKKLR